MVTPHDHDRDDQDEPGQPAEPEPEDEAGHDRPDIADMRASLATARAILDGADHSTTHQAAQSGTCPACVAAAGVSFMINTASTIMGDTTMGVSERSRRVLLAYVDAAEAELRGASN